jgi:flagellar biosynthesis repressor protein FlbT
LLTVARKHHYITPISWEAAVALKVELRPGERIIIGDSVLTNHDHRAYLLIEGAAPILRERDIMTLDCANTPAKRIYLAVQLIYTSREPRAHHELYFTLVREILTAAPSVLPYIERINNHILTGQMYKALKEAKNLIRYEQDLIDHASRSTDLPSGSEANRESA